MNLRGVYEIFYPRKEKIHPPVWKEQPKYRSKKDFFEEIFPMELRWLNIKIWSDKARRSRFFTDSKAEKSYVSMLKHFILQNPMVISRMENKGNLILKKEIFPQTMNQIFFQIEEQEQISFSPTLRSYLQNEGLWKYNTMHFWEEKFLLIYISKMVIW